MNQAHPPRRRADLFALPTARPWRTVALVLAIALASVLLVRTIRTDGSLQSMLPAHDSSSAAMGRIAQSFGLANDVTLLVQAGPGATDPADELTGFARRFESAMRGAEPGCQVRWAWPSDAQDWSRQVLVPNLLLYLDQTQQQALQRRLTPQGMAAQFRKNERLAASPGLAGSAMTALLEDPLGLHQFISATYSDLAQAGGGRPGRPMLSPDGRALLIQVQPTDPTHDSAQANAVVDAVRHAVEVADPVGLDVGLAGGLAIASVAERSIRADMIASSIGTVLLLQVLFLATYRRLLLFPIAFVPAAVGVLVGFGVFALTGRALSPPTAVLGALLAGLGIDYAIHYLAHAGGAEPLDRVGRRMARPLGIACVTSVLAFLTLIASDVAALRDFATIGAVGLAATLLTSLLLLPALLQLLSRFSAGHINAIATPRWRIDRVIDLSIRHRRVGMGLSCAALLAGAGVLLFHPGGPVAFDSELSNMHPKPNAPLQTQQQIAQAFPGQGETLMLYLTAPDEDQLIERAALSAQRLHTDPAAQRIVTATLGLHALLPTRQQAQQRRAFAQSIDVQAVLADFDRAADESLFNPEVFAGYRQTLAETLRPGDGPTLADLSRLPDLAAGLLPSAPIDSTDAPQCSAISLLSIAHPPQTRAARGQMIASIRSALDGVPGVTLTGFSVVGHDIETQVRRELPRLLLIAGVAVVGWLVLCYRNLRDTLLALLPVALGLLITFALMRVMGIGLNLLNLVALPLLVGLGVDDGVLMVSIARDCRSGHKPRGHLVSGLSMSAQAVTMTSVTTALAFGSLMLTAVPAIRGLGAVMAMGILACWLVTVALLAPLLARGAAAGAGDGSRAEGGA